MNGALVRLNQFGALFVSHAGSMFVQASVLILLLWVLDHVLRRYLRASLRYGLWMLVLVKLVLSPSFSLPTGIGNLGRVANRVAGILPARIQAVSPSHVESTTSSAKDQLASTRGQAAPEMRNQNTRGASQRDNRNAEDTPVLLTWSGITLVVWLVGVVVLVIALLVRAAFTQRIIRDARPASAAMLELLARCQREVALATQVRLKLTRDLSGPAVCRAWRPVILVPQALTDGLPEDKLRTILIHELCHIKRADPWVSLVQTLLQVFYFYNPLVWLANTSIRRVREQAVDERVLVCLKGQLQCYSHTLIDIAAAMSFGARLGMGLIGVPESKTRLNERIELMLHRPTPHNAGLGFKGLATLVVLGCALLPMAAGVGAHASAGGTFAPADAQTSEKFFADIQSGVDSMATAFNGRQIDSLMSYYTADAIEMAPGQPALVGTDAIGKSYEVRISAGLQLKAFKLPQQRVWMCGDQIYMAGPYAMTVQSPGASHAVTDNRCGIVILQRQEDGTPKIKLEAYNRPGTAAIAADPGTRMVDQCTAASSAATASAELCEQIRDLERRFERLFTENKRAEGLGWYTDDAVLITGGYVFQGKPQLKTMFEQDPGHHPMQDIELKFAHVEGNEQMVYVVKWCGWKLKNPVSGMDYTIPGKSLHVWQRQADGSWKILLDLNNMDIVI